MHWLVSLMTPVHPALVANSAHQLPMMTQSIATQALFLLLLITRATMTVLIARQVTGVTLPLPL